MQGTFGDLFIPSLSECLWVASPILAFLIARWFLSRVTDLIDRRASGWNWEKEMGWLNLRTERRAAALWRALTAGGYALLAITLYGIVWSLPGVVAFLQSTDTTVVSDGFAKLPVLLFCAGFWLVYLGFCLLPKLWEENEREELERFRLENPHPDAEAESSPRFSPDRITVWNSTPVSPTKTADRSRPR